MNTLLKRKLVYATNYLSVVELAVRENRNERGYKKRLADVAGCQPAYLSQVLSGSVQLTPEQGEKLCSFWDLNEVESEYFFTLVLLGRAGTPSLRERLQSKLKFLRAQWESQDATFAKPALTESDRASIYYSNWLYSAIHVLLTVPKLRTSSALASHLGLEQSKIERALKRLEKVGLVIRTDKMWTATQAHVHSPDTEVSAEQHHRNWRLQSLQKGDSEDKKAVRYTDVHTLSAADFRKIREILDEAIRKARLTIEPSPEEFAACLTIDYFSLHDRS